MFRSLSGLTTRGRCLLAAGLAAGLCAAVLNERDLLRVAVFVIALPLCVVLLASTSRMTISAARSLLPERIPVGGHGEVQLDLWRTGRMPTGEVLVEDCLPYTLGGRARFMVERLPQRHSVPLRYPVRPTLRGVHRIGPLRATITDAFGLCEFQRDLVSNSRLVVVPRVSPLLGLPRGGGAGSGEDSSARPYAGQGETDIAVRQYRQGDDVRKVHWRSTARRDELMVRVEERPWHSGTTVLLDRRASAHGGTGVRASLEWGVEFTASVCVHLTESGHRVRLVNEHGRPLADTPEEASAAHTGAVLDALAALSPGHERDIVLGADPGQGQDLIAVLGTVGSESVDELTRHRARGSHSFAVLLDAAAWDDSAAPAEEGAVAVGDTAALLRAAGWRVVVTKPERTVADVWSELCRAMAPGAPVGGGRGW